MEEKKTYGNVYITNDMLEVALENVCGDKYYGIKMLFHGMLQESHKGSEWFMKFMMGERIPNLPYKGQEVYVSINRIAYTVDEKLYENSPYNENGFIKCIVTGFSGFHNYSPITVELPKLDPSDKADKLKVRIDFSEWKYADKDLYDKESDLVEVSQHRYFNGSGTF